MTLVGGAILLLAVAMLAISAGLLGTYKQVQQLRAAVFSGVGDALAQGQLPREIMHDQPTPYVILGIEGVDRDVAVSLIDVLVYESQFAPGVAFAVVANEQYESQSWPAIEVHNRYSVRRSLQIPWAPYLLFADEHGRIEELVTAGSPAALTSKLERHLGLFQSHGEAT